MGDAHINGLKIVMGIYAIAVLGAFFFGIGVVGWVLWINSWVGFGSIALLLVLLKVGIGQIDKGNDNFAFVAFSLSFGILTMHLMAIATMGRMIVAQIVLS